MSNRRSHPLDGRIEEALGSSVRLRIARYMTDLPEQEFTGRELARLLRVSHTSVHEAMETLVANGLVHRRSIGRAFLYRVNKDSYIFGALRELFHRDRRVLGIILSDIRAALGTEVISATLFGSHAKGTASPGSDIDVLVVTSAPDTTEECLHRLRTLILRRYGIGLSAKSFSLAEVRRKKALPFIRNALSEGVLIAGRPLDEMMRDGR